MKKKIYLTEFSPELASEFHPTKNGSLTADQLTIGSGKKIWWKCQKGEDHEWPAVVNKRTFRKQGCPFCSGRYADSKTNLAVNYPELLNEWDWVKNNSLGLDPYKLLPKSGKEAYWICEKNNHSYKTEVFNRTRGHGCPKCVNIIVEISNSLFISHPDLCEEWDYDLTTDIGPTTVSSGSNKKVFWKCQKKHSWPATINSRVRGNKCPYCANQKVCKDNCLATVRPDLAYDWHPFLNGSHTPENTLPSAALVLFWFCEEYHIYEATVNKRYNGAGCPYCSNHRVSRKNNLGILFPKLVEEWDYEKNNDTPFEVSISSDKRQYWICKKCNHSWRTNPSSRTRQPNPTGCPACSGRVATSKNNLELRFPDIAKEWHPTLNSNQKPSEFLSHSNYIAVWLCEFGHDWTSTISNRVLGNGCPKCRSKSSKKELRVFSELNTVFDCKSQKEIDGMECDIFISEFNLAIEYDGCYYHQIRYKEDKRKNTRLKKNGLDIIRLREIPLRKISNNDIIISSKQLNPGVIVDLLLYIKNNYKVSSKHRKIIREYSEGTQFINDSEYKKLIHERKRPPQGRSLGELFPELSNEWDYRKNSPITPFNVYAKSGIKYGWICHKKHTWDATPDHRIRGTGCPSC